MSFVKIWVHIVFSTRNRENFLSKSIRHDVHQHIIENCKEKGIFLQAINGMSEHLHCLISLGKDQTISQVAHLIKGELSFWINKHQITLTKFSWQDDYFAVSVSESNLAIITNYIKNQEKHHSDKTYADEVNEFMLKYGFQHINEK